MDELTLLCAQELLDELMNTASSSDEDEEKQQEMEVLAFLCAQNLVDDLMDTSSSADEDDEFFAILSYSYLLERSEALTKKCQDNDIISTKSSSQGQSNPKLEAINALLESRKLAIAAVLEKSTNNSKETLLENCLSNLSAECNYTENSTTFAKHNEEAKENQIYHFHSPFYQGINDRISDDEFKHYFHINRESFAYLMDRFTSWYCKGSYEQTIQKTNIKTTLLTFLWFCANPVSFESVARMFNASLLDSKDYLNIILEFFEKEFSEVIKLPTSYIEKEAIAKDFEKIAGFPNVLGCLAVSSFSVKLPELVEACGSSQLYLRGICDSNRKFLSKKITFSREFENGTFSEKVLPKLCFPKYHLLCDATSRIRDHLVIPYINTENLTESEQLFNTKLGQTHVKIKQTFGMLRNRFRQLQYLDFNNIETLSKFMTACCILHNICIDRQDFYDDETYNMYVSPGQFESSFSSVQTDDFLNDIGLKKRRELTQILFRRKK